MGSAVSSHQETVDPGKTVIADVDSDGALMHAPRQLRLLIGAGRVCVREPGGRLIWLETDRLSAFTDTDGQVAIARHDDNEATLVPRDTGTEARALISLDAFRGWIDARSESAPTPAQPHLDRPAQQLTLTTEDGRSVALTLDLETGIILAARGRSLRGNFELQVTALKIRDTAPTDFTPL